MSKRWAVASDPGLLARIAEQERRKGAGGSIAPVVPARNLVKDTSAATKKEPSAATKRANRVALNNQDSRLDSLHYDADGNILTIVLAGAELLSHNTSLRMHNAKQTQLKNTWLKRIEALMLTNLATYDQWKLNQGRAFPLLVEEVYATGEGCCLDTESVAAACKPIIDALVRTRFIPDDRAEFIAQPIAYTYRQRANGLVLVLRPAPKPWGLISDTTMAVAQGIPTLP